MELARTQGCRLQMGGSDQWGNIVNGIELARRMGGQELYGLTTPLLTTAGGQKMGKTAAGAVWLSPKRLSHYDYYQYWRNADDADVGRFLKLFTDLPLDEIARLEALEGREINEAKKVLAFEATELCRGTAAAEEAAETARQTFEEGAVAETLPTVEVPRDRFEAGIPFYALLAEAGLCASNGEARRLIKGGGGRVNDARVEDESAPIGPDRLLPDGVVKLSAGRKKHALVKPV
jgi:tyrosyl-tRNA synthetase